MAFWVGGRPGADRGASPAALSWLHEYVRARAVVGRHERDRRGDRRRSGRPGSWSPWSGCWSRGAAGFIEPDLAAGTLTIALAVWALLALFGLGQLFGAVRRSLRPRAGSRSR